MKPPKPPQLMAVSHVQRAKEYLKAAGLLDECVRGPLPSFSAPVHHLIGHAIELALKAYLLSSGEKLKVTRHEIGHDISLAYKRAADLHGFVLGGHRFEELVLWLGPYHKSHFFRYPGKTGYYQFPTAQAVIEIVAPVFEGIDRYVRQKFSECHQRQQSSEEGRVEQP